MELLIKDVVRLLNVPEDTVYRWIAQKELPACSVNGQYRINKIDLLEWATKSGITITTGFHGLFSGQGPALPGILDALTQGGIYYDIKGSDKPSVLKYVVDTIRLPGNSDKNLLLQVLLAREALGSTGIGDGIAIPHPRNPIVLNVELPFLSLLFLEKPVDFDSLDNVPVFVLFTLISPTVRIHLHLLSRIAFLLHNKDFKEKLKLKAPAEQILADIHSIETKLVAEQHP